MRVPESVLKCVVFLGLKPMAVEKPSWVGTALLVAYLDPDMPGVGFQYLVTAKHVADDVEGKNYVIRANKKDGGVALVRQDKNRWWRHPDRTVDVAVAPLPISDKLDVMHVPTSMFLTREHFGTRIGLGDEVFITGLFVPTAGEGPNTPIVRAGNLAMVPRFRVRFRGEDVDVMLIEVRSLGGLSGSPVFARETLHLPGVTHDNKTSFLTGSSRDFHLIGLTSGHWDVDERELNAPYAEVKNKCDPHGVNMGIAVVVPASKILEVLEHSDLKEQRRVELPPPTSHAAAD